MIEVKDLLQRSEQLLNLGIDYLCLHTAFDRQKNEKAPLSALKRVKNAFPQAKLAIAGGVGLDTIDEVAKIGPDIVIVGGAITTAKDPADVARRLRKDYTMANNIHQLTDQITSEIQQALRQVSEQDVETMRQILLSGARIFVAGRGRSGLQMKAAAMRLMHLGLQVYVIGDVTTPAIAQDDLLLIGSGSGETASLVQYAEKAKAVGAKIAIITTNTNSVIAKMADNIVTLPAPTPR